MEYLARTQQPVDNPVHRDTTSLDDRIDERITHILGRTLEGEAPTDSVRVSIKAMTWQAFELHVADLLRRDGCTQVVVRQARSDRGIDITACTADGRAVAVQCKNRDSRSSVPSADMQKFAGAARTINPAEVALFVATSHFSREAQAIADLSGIITVNRDELEAWTAGVRLKALR